MPRKKSPATPVATAPTMINSGYKNRTYSPQFKWDTVRETRNLPRGRQKDYCKEKGLDRQLLWIWKRQVDQGRLKDPNPDLNPPPAVNDLDERVRILTERIKLLETGKPSPASISLHTQEIRSLVDQAQTLADRVRDFWERLPSQPSSRFLGFDPPRNYSLLAAELEWVRQTFFRDTTN